MALDDLLGPRHVFVAGKLHQDLVAGVPVGRDDGLRDPQLVHPAPDGLHRLGDRLLADHDFLAGTEVERPVAAAGAPEIPARPAEGDDVPDFTHAGLVQIQNGELPQSFGFDVREVDFLVVEVFGELLGGLVGQDPHRVLGVDPHDEVNAALQIQPQHDGVPGRVDDVDEPCDQEKEQDSFEAKASGHQLAAVELRNCPAAQCFLSITLATALFEIWSFTCSVTLSCTMSP